MKELYSSERHNFKILETKLFDSAVEIHIKCRYQEKVQLHLLNASHEDGYFQVAEPWSNGFDTAVKWAFRFSRNASKAQIKEALEQTRSCGWGKGSYTESFVEALAVAARLIKKTRKELGYAR